jgi:hypothetical protein
MPRRHVSDGCSPLNAPAPNSRALIPTPPKSHNPCAGVLVINVRRVRRLPRWRSRAGRCLSRPWNAVDLVRLTVDIGWAARCWGRPSRVPSRMAPLLARLPPLRDVFSCRGRRHIRLRRRRRGIGRRRGRRRCRRHRLCLLSAGGQSDCRRNRQHYWYGSSLDHNRLPSLSATVDNRDQLALPSLRLQETARTLQQCSRCG